jgi:hypothetical protein
MNILDHHERWDLHTSRLDRPEDGIEKSDRKPKIFKIQFLFVG